MFLFLFLTHEKLRNYTKGNNFFKTLKYLEIILTYKHLYNIHSNSLTPQIIFIYIGQFLFLFVGRI